MLSSRGFIVLHFTFRSVITLSEFSEGCRSVFRSVVVVVLHVDMQLFQHHLLKRLSMPHCTAFALFAKIRRQHSCGSTYGLSILFH